MYTYLAMGKGRRCELLGVLVAVIILLVFYLSGLAIPMVGALSGALNTSITFEAQPLTISAFSSTLTEIYEIGSFRITGSGTWAKTGWSALSFIADFPVGEEVTVRSTIAFDTSSLILGYWKTVTDFSVFDIDFKHTFYLTNQTDSYNQFLAQWDIGDVSFTSTTKFTGYTLCFDEEVITARWNWVDCDLQLEASLSIKCVTGFEEFWLKVGEIPIFASEVGNFGIYLGQIKLKFTTSSKELTPTFTCKSDWIGCLRIYCELIIDDAGITLGGVSLYGIKLETAFPGGIELVMATSFAENKNSSMTGYSDYFEVFRLSGSIAPCCGAPGIWKLATYFRCDDSTELFEWGMMTFEMETALSDQLRVSTEITFCSEDPQVKWECGVKLIW